jgi:hypothetical protein
MKAARRRAIALIAVGISTTAATAWAYSVPNHVTLTGAAVAQIQACIEAHPGRWDGLRVLAAQQEALVRCNEAQDAPYRKLTLWHFFKRDQELRGTFVQGAFLARETSFNHFFQLLAQHMRTQPVQEGRVYASAGALIHYLQDAAVPAHAVPVYHPSPLWNFDNFDERDVPTNGEMPTDRATCERLLESRSDTMEWLLQMTAAATLKSLEAEPWGKFWEPWDPKRDDRGFGYYGCVGDAFGAEHPRCDGTDLTIPSAAYVDFAAVRHRAALEATVRAIMIAHRFSPPGASAVSPPACPVACRGPHDDVILCEP